MEKQVGIQQIITGKNAFVALCSASLVYQTSVRVNSVGQWIPAALVFLGTLLAYGLHSIVKHRQSHDRFSVSGVISIVVISILCLILTSALSKVAIVLISICALITLLYTLPWIPGLNGKRSLRHLPFLKTVFVAVVWAVLTVLVPLVEDGVYSKVAGLMLTERFFFILAITIPFDIRDMVQDEKEGIRTFPRVIGIFKTKLLSLIVLAFFLLTSLLEFGIFQQSFPVTIALSISFTITALEIISVRSDSKMIKYTFQMEGMSLIQTLIVVMFFFLL